MHEDDRDDTPPISCDEKPTSPLPEAFLMGRLEVVVDDPESVANFLDRVSRILRKRGRVALIVE